MKAELLARPGETAGSHTQHGTSLAISMLGSLSQWPPHPSCAWAKVFLPIALWLEELPEYRLPHLCRNLPGYPAHGSWDTVTVLGITQGRMQAHVQSSNRVSCKTCSRKKCWQVQPRLLLYQLSHSQTAWWEEWCILAHGQHQVTLQQWHCYSS